MIMAQLRGSILCLNADWKLKPKIGFMKTLGLPTQDLGNVISNGSRLLSSSLEKTLRPNIQYLQNLFGSEVNVSIVFKSAPLILIKCNGREFWEKKLKHLTSFGLLEGACDSRGKKDMKSLCEESHHQKKSLIANRQSLRRVSLPAEESHRQPARPGLSCPITMEKNHFSMKNR